MVNKKILESAVIKLFSEASQESSEVTFDDVDRIKKDIDVKSALNKINRNVASRDYFLRTSNDEIDDEKLVEIQNIFSRLKFNRVFNEILEARLYGYSCFEIVYAEDYRVDTLIPIPVKSVKFDDKDKVWRVEAGNNKIEITHEKFLLCIHRWKPNKVTGETILESCKASFLDKEMLENQLRGISQKYGDVITVFGFDPSEEEIEVQKRAENLKEMHGKTAIGVPVEGLGVVDGADISKAVQFIKLSDLNPEIYTNLIRTEKLKLIQNILGSTLTMDVGDIGSQALGTIHMEAEEQVVEECCSFISDCLQNLLEAVLPLHGYEPSEFYFSLEKKRDIFKDLEVKAKTELVQTQKIENISKLVAAGYPLSKEYVAEQLGIDPSQIQEPVLEFASKKKDLDSMLDKKRSIKDKILKLAEESFLKSFSSNLKEQLITQIKSSESFLKPLDFNFDAFYEHALIVKLMAYLEEGESVEEFEEEVNPFEMKFHEAIAYAVKKKPELIDKIDIMQEEVRAQSFWVKRSTEITATEKLMKDLQKNLDNGGTYKEWLKDISNVADRVGMGNDGWYSANVYRTNMLSFYNAGVYEQQMDNIENQPYWMYDGIADGRQSDICKELDGKVYAAKDPIWGRVYPPNHYQCRSGVIALSADDIEAMGLKVSKPSKKIKEMNMESFEGNPANSYWKKLEKNVIIKEETVTKEIVKQAAKEAVKNKNLGYKIDSSKVFKDTKKREFEQMINETYFTYSTERQQEIGNYLLNKSGVNVKVQRILEVGRSEMTGYVSRSTGKVVECVVKTTKEAPAVFSHEFGHAVDRVMTDVAGRDAKNDFVEAIKKYRKMFNGSIYSKDIEPEVEFSTYLKDKLAKAPDNAKAQFEKYMEHTEKYKALKKKADEVYHKAKKLRGDPNLYNEMVSEYNKVLDVKNAFIDKYLLSKEMYHQFSDIVDMLVTSSRGSEYIILGHNNDSRLSETEIFAELHSLEAESGVNEDAKNTLDLVKTLFPEVYKGYDKTMTIFHNYSKLK